MAIGVEKLKDSGYSGLFDFNPTSTATEGDITPPAAFSMIVPGLRQEATASTRRPSRT
jgi:hypothetical protein